MRQRFIGGALLAAAAVLGGAGSIQAQVPTSVGADPQGNPYQIPITVRGQVPDSGFDAPLNSDPVIPIPTGKTGAAGFYASAEFVTLTQTRTLGSQAVAYRGLLDSTGAITQVPGTYVGSGRQALNTNQLGRTSFSPGFQLEVGYRFEDGTQLYASNINTFKVQYSAGASLAPQYGRTNGILTDTFLLSGVFNFSPQYSGPALKTQYDTGSSNPGFNTYGIWNGATTEDIKFSQRFEQYELGGRVPIYATDYSRVYGLAGGRFAWFFERFTWRTVDADINGNTLPQYAANYTNTLSQRMYGPFIGTGHEIFLANQFSLSLDLTGALLLDVIKERAKYELGDKSTEAKRSYDDYSIVPNVNASLNLWWYPIEGVQVRVGYQVLSYFNTKNMIDPIGFDMGAIDPVYNTQVFRVVHGVNAGISLFF